MSNRAVPLLADLIRRPSVTPIEEGVLDVLEAFLSPLGFVCTRLKFEGDGSYPVDNLYATRKGKSPDHICCLPVTPTLSLLGMSPPGPMIRFPAKSLMASCGAAAPPI